MRATSPEKRALDALEIIFTKTPKKDLKNALAQSSHFHLSELKIIISRVLSGIEE